MLVLFETAAGYAIFKVEALSLGVQLLASPEPSSSPSQLLDEGKLQQVDDLYRQFETADSANKL